MVKGGVSEKGRARLEAQARDGSAVVFRKVDGLRFGNKAEKPNAATPHCLILKKRAQAGGTQARLGARKDGAHLCCLGNGVGPMEKRVEVIMNV